MLPGDNKHHIKFSTTSVSIYSPVVRRLILYTSSRSGIQQSKSLSLRSKNLLELLSIHFINMKLSLIALAGLAVALPTELTAENELAKQHELAKRQATTANDLSNGKCGTAVFIFARGSTEAGNMV